MVIGVGPASLFLVSCCGAVGVLVSRACCTESCGSPWVCVCVTHLNRCKTSACRVLLFIISAGGQPRVHSWLPNEEGYATTDMESDQLHVPAPVFNFNRCMACGQAKNRLVEHLEHR